MQSNLMVYILHFYLQFNIQEGVGEFDLGLIKEVRGKGYGNWLLETAISF